MAPVPSPGPDAIRLAFSRAMSAMYRSEVPQYGTLLDLVRDVNAAVLDADPALRAHLARTGELERIGDERHGAIRLGTAAELSDIRRVFAVMGMEPVGYYDLAAAGVPVHSTAFRPVGDTALAACPFRVFTSLIRLELIEDPELRARAAAILARRQIVSPRLMALVARHEAGDALDSHEGAEFVAEALEIFRWHSAATVDFDIYRQLHAAHRLIADVVCFRGPHINHLTPRTLDIDRVQALMPARGITPKETIEGPPPRRCPILLRQTSFKALEEAIAFTSPDGAPVAGHHTARFGEIEQRGAALTEAGRMLYDRLLAHARANAGGRPYDQALRDVFTAFPDTWDGLRRQGLAFFRYAATPAGRAADAADRDGLDVDGLIDAGFLACDPLVYEDFLPVSAAGIFQSNLGGGGPQAYRPSDARAAFEAALGRPVLNELDLYATQQAASLRQALADLDRSDLAA
ncbi:2-oxoadipate dioxygenase/decarboxylase HglS [Gluconacetobacter tumulisoli]|uniref:2-oxoadipate dioxygenase/decarboxylase n=1 Tax=Gluconacetobacter tumulisoli TaxID=1286189 RepID=A0A7W4K4G5_9PROT|nr:VOC family protein [Gluconacetobacter tumulisoli]MBB2200088.1 VOC family protein [Gluconacetobacter tumulisoli]